MAALVDTSIPEITRQISREAVPEMIEPDVVVKSKPRPVEVIQQNGEDEEEREIEPDVIVKSKPIRPVDLVQDTDPAVDRSMERSCVASDDGHVRIDQQQSLSPTSTMGQASEVRQKKANGDVPGLTDKKVAPSQAVAESIEQVAVKRDEEEFEDSTAMLLRRYTGSRNGRHAHIPITSTGEIGGNVSLKEMFRVLGKSCTVRLEEDYISWVSNGKKDGELISILSTLRQLKMS